MTAGFVRLAAPALIALAVAAGPATAHAQTARGAAPGSDAARGLVYSGLHRASAGPCRGGFEVDAPGLRKRCTHGPDPAPAGVDVREHRTAAELSRAMDASPGADAGTAQVPCIGDGESGNRVQLIYAVGSNQQDRYGAVLPAIQSSAADMAADVEGSAEETGGFRTLRFVTSGCQVVVDHVVLSPSGMSDLGSMAGELTAKGYDRPDRDYVVFADANVYCGIAYINDHFARADSGCWDGHIALHELTHNLGAVQLLAPNSSGGWHCTDEWDVMCYSDDPFYPAMRFVCPSAHEYRLDCNHDDYFSTAPPAGNFLSEHPDFDVADSTFMADADGAPPVYLPAAPPDYEGPNYTVRAYNADDDICVYATRASNGQRVRLFCIGYRGDRTADVTGALLEAARGASTGELKLIATDRGDQRSFGFTVWEDDVSILDDREGEAGVSSSSRPLGAADPGTGWPIFYEQALQLDLNSPPTADFTYSPLSPATGDTVSFASTSSDPNGDLQSQAWDLDGDGQYDDATGPVASTAFAVRGTHTVGIKVIDATGAEALATHVVQVDNRSPATSFTFAPATPVAGDNVTFTSTSTDPDGVVASQAWDLDGDGYFLEGTGPSASVSFATAGPHAVRLRAVDELGAATVATQTIQVASAGGGTVAPGGAGASAFPGFGSGAFEPESAECREDRAKLARALGQLRSVRRKLSAEQRRLKRSFRRLRSAGWPAAGVRRYNRARRQYRRGRAGERRLSQRVEGLRDLVFVECPLPRA